MARAIRPAPGLLVLRVSQSGDDTYAPALNVDQVLLIAPGHRVITDMQRLGKGMFSFRFYGEPGDSCVVQASTNTSLDGCSDGWRHRGND
ncbi:MAG: hypothetical protein KIS67_13735 [Verrucomicrobiae bacterium]|nr:hypothetical protein [Verrucomicrobiae bacterium]